MFTRSAVMTQRPFGSVGSTGLKLEILHTYLVMYQRTLHKRFRTRYIDAFAGSGVIPYPTHSEELPLELDEDTIECLKGSSLRALELENPFSEYIFIEKRKRCLDELRERTKIYQDRKCDFRNGDCNEELIKLCAQKNWTRNDRGVVFLDPFGSQVRWETIEAIAATQKLDLWYLFPSGYSVFRQVSNSGTVLPEHRPAIDRIFGTTEWLPHISEPTGQTDLFDAPSAQTKAVTSDWAADFMIARLQSVFQGHVPDLKVGLSNRGGYPGYHLLFASGNPSKPAVDLSRRLAFAAVKAMEKRRGRLI
jgi:three-Cys-motif partner protein